MKRRKQIGIILLCGFLCTGTAGCGETVSGSADTQTGNAARSENIALEEIPEYSGQPYVEINGNVPELEEEAEESYETYSPLDELGRCGTAEANVGTDTMPTKEREGIGQVKPSGWHTVKYDHVDGKYLYNRCHLIGYQLTAENVNEENLITGTRYMNVEGMLPFENMVADYVKETGNHVQYRVTPVYEGDNLVASGVQMEARSVEDAGEGISYNVFVYNVQPGVEIDYATGESRESTDAGADSRSEDGQKETYILNTNTKKFHRPSCSSAEEISAKNRQEFTGTKEEVTAQGYEACQRCRP